MSVIRKRLATSRAKLNHANKSNLDPLLQSANNLMDWSRRRQKIGFLMPV